MLAQSSSGGGGGGHTAAKTSHAHATSYAAAPHPVVEAIQHAISVHAAQHVLNVVQHHQRSQAAIHAAHGAAHHMNTHLPRNPYHDHPGNILAKFAQAEVQNSMAHPQYAPGTPLVMGPGGVLIPAQVVHQQQAYQNPMQGPDGYNQQVHPGQYAGNNSIANPDQGGDSGIMGLLQGLFGG